MAISQCYMEILHFSTPHDQSLYSDPFLNKYTNRTFFFVPLTTTFSTIAVNTAGSNSRHSSCPASMRMNSDIRFLVFPIAAPYHSSVKTTLREFIFLAHSFLESQEFPSCDYGIIEHFVCQCHGCQVSDYVVHSYHLRVVATGGDKKGRFPCPIPVIAIYSCCPLHIIQLS